MCSHDAGGRGSLVLVFRNFTLTICPLRRTRATSHLLRHIASLAFHSDSSHERTTRRRARSTACEKGYADVSASGSSRLAGTVNKSANTSRISPRPIVSTAPGRIVIPEQLEERRRSSPQSTPRPIFLPSSGICGTAGSWPTGGTEGCEAAVGAVGDAPGRGC